MANTGNAVAAPVLSKFAVGIKRLMFATDFSKVSLAALPFAAAIARAFDSEIYLFHTIMPNHSYRLMADAPLAQKDAMREMRNLARSPLLTDVQIASEEIVQGDVTAVQKYVEQNEIDLLVIGTHGRRGFERLMLGSFAEAVVRTASCPVLTVGPYTKPLRGQEFSPAQVLFATDASPDSFRALHDATVFAHKRGELTVIHVLPKGHENSPEATAFATLMRDALHRTLPLETIKRCNPEVVVKFGDTVECILSAASERGSELIVMASRSTAIKREGKGKNSVSYGVITRATCPVLTVRGRQF